MKKASVFLLVLAGLFSCVKKSEDQNPSSTSNPYYPSTKGSYWIYKNYKIDSTGDEEELPGTDSVVISGDSVINGKTYTVLKGTNNPFYSQWQVLSLMRDSSGYILNTRGKAEFSSVDLNDTMSVSYDIVGTPDSPDTFLVSKYYMAGPPASIHVPAGDFTMLNVIRDLKVWKSAGLLGRRYYNCYAPGVGLVLSQNSYEYQIQLGIYFERRLLRYHINP